MLLTYGTYFSPLKSPHTSLQGVVSSPGLELRKEFVIAGVGVSLAPGLLLLVGASVIAEQLQDLIKLALQAVDAVLVVRDDFRMQKAVVAGLVFWLEFPADRLVLGIALVVEVFAGLNILVAHDEVLEVLDKAVQITDVATV